MDEESATQVLYPVTDPDSDPYEEDSSDPESERDLAITHGRDYELAGRPAVRDFMSVVFNMPRLLSGETCAWIGSAPFVFQEHLIPLFEDPRTDKDYQLHPSYSWIPLGKPAEKPYFDLLRLSTKTKLGGCELDISSTKDLLMCLGHLFVNAKEGTSSKRRSKWTGYEVLVDRQLNLWIAFVRSLANGFGGDWYPVTCEVLSVPDELKPEAIASDPSRYDFFDLAILGPIQMICATTADRIRMHVEETAMYFEGLEMDQVDQNEDMKIDD